MTDGHGTPLVLSLTGGNHNAITQLMLLLEAAPVRGRRGRPTEDPSDCWPTASTTTTSTAAWSGARASNRSSPAAAARTARAGRPPLPRQAHHRPAAPVPPPAHPLGDPRRHPPSLQAPGRRHHPRTVVASKVCGISGPSRLGVRPCTRGLPWWTGWRNQARHRGGIGQVVDRGSSRPRGASLVIIRVCWRRLVR